MLEETPLKGLMLLIPRGVRNGIDSITCFSTHLIASELERHNAYEYKSHECSELEHDPKYRPH
jgi:hypothetical protein